MVMVYIIMMMFNSKFEGDFVNNVVNDKEGIYKRQTHQQKEEENVFIRKERRIMKGVEELK